MINSHLDEIINSRTASKIFLEDLFIDLSNQIEVITIGSDTYRFLALLGDSYDKHTIMSLRNFFTHFKKDLEAVDLQDEGFGIFAHIKEIKDLNESNPMEYLLGQDLNSWIEEWWRDAKEQLE